MHTEDDTFRALSRISFAEMMKIVVAYNRKHNWQDRGVVLSRIMKENGWTVKDYERKRLDSKGL